MQAKVNSNEVPAGVVGLGLMGCSITTCLLMAGHKVTAIAPIEIDLLHAEKRIHDHLLRSQKEGLVKEAPEYYFNNLLITMDYAALKDCMLVSMASLLITASIF